MEHRFVFENKAFLFESEEQGPGLHSSLFLKLGQETVLTPLSRIKKEYITKMPIHCYRVRI